MNEANEANEAAMVRQEEHGTEDPDDADPSVLRRGSASAIQASRLAGVVAPFVVAFAGGGPVSLALASIAGNVGSDRLGTVLERLVARLRSQGIEPTDDDLHTLLAEEFQPMLSGHPDEAEEILEGLTAIEASLTNLDHGQAAIHSDVRALHEQTNELREGQRELMSYLPDRLSETLADIIEQVIARITLPPVQPQPVQACQPAQRPSSTERPSSTIVPILAAVPDPATGWHAAQPAWEPGAELQIGDARYMLFGDLLAETFSESEGVYHRQARAVRTGPRGTLPPRSEHHVWLRQVATSHSTGKPSTAHRRLTREHEFAKQLTTFPEAHDLVTDGGAATLILVWPTDTSGDPVATLAAEYGLRRGPATAAEPGEGPPVRFDSWRLKGLCRGMAEVCSTLAELHDRGVAHRALHPWQLLIRDDE